MNIEEAIQRLTIEYKEKGIAETGQKIKAIAGAEVDLTTATRNRTAATEAAAAAYERQMRTYQDAMRIQQQMLGMQREQMAANANLARSYGAANDNTRQASDTWRSSAVDIGDLTNHLKAAALAAYIVSPAFRQMLNPAITQGVKDLAPAFFSVAGAIGKAFLPAISNALSFLARISVPILAAVGAWEGLNAIITKGSNLLETYGNASRSLDSPNMKANLDALTKLQQQDESVTGGQAKYAAELNTRLAEAKFRLSEVFKTQFDINDAALGLQSIWVGIVELAAKYADSIAKAAATPPPDVNQTGLSGARRAAGSRIPADIDPTGLTLEDPTTVAMRDAAQKVSELAAARKRAMDQISVTLGSRAAAGGDANSGLGSTFGAHWNAIIDALTKKTEGAKEPVKALANEFDRMVASMARSNAAQEADARTVGQSAGEVARLRAEFKLTEAAQQDIAKNGSGSLSDYAARIKTASDRAADAAANFAKMNLASQMKFTDQTMFLSDRDVSIAQKLVPIYGSDVPKALASSEAAALRVQMAEKGMFDAAKSGAEQFTSSLVSGLMQGKSLMDSLKSAADSLASSMASSAIKDLFSGQWEKAGVEAVIAVGAKIAGNLLDDSAQKALEQAKLDFAKMADEVRDFMQIITALAAEQPKQKPAPANDNTQGKGNVRGERRSAA